MAGSASPASPAAQALFCTPLPPKWVSRRQAAPRGFEVSCWPFEGVSLVLYRPRAVTPDAPVVLRVHGWGGSGLQWSALAEPLLAQGFAPVMLDFPAHGRAEGWRSNLPQFNRALEYVIQRLVLHRRPVRPWATGKALPPCSAWATWHVPRCNCASSPTKPC